MPGHEEREGEDSEEASDFAHSSSDTMAGGADFDGEDLRGVDEGSGVGAEFGEEIAEAVDDEEGVDEFFNVGDEG